MKKGIILVVFIFVGIRILGQVKIGSPTTVKPPPASIPASSSRPVKPAPSQLPVTKDEKEPYSYLLVSTDIDIRLTVNYSQTYYDVRATEAGRRIPLESGANVIKVIPLDGGLDGYTETIILDKPGNRLFKVALGLKRSLELQKKKEVVINHSNNLNGMIDVSSSVKTLPPMMPSLPMEEDKIYMDVEEVPLFHGCDSYEIKEDKKKCSDKKVFEFIFSNLKYPLYAKDIGIEGTVVVQFVINTDGSVNDVSVLKDIGGGCGEEAVRIVNLMNESGIKWIPGRQSGRKVKVKYRLPVRFKLL